MKARPGRATREFGYAAAVAEVAVALAGPPDLARVFERGVRSVVAALGASGAVAHVLDAESAELRLTAAVGYGAESLERLERLALDGPSVLSQVAREHRPVLVQPGGEAQEALTPFAREIIAREGIHSGLYLPLLAQEELVGTLGLKFADDRSTNPRVRETATAVAALLAAAVRTARLYEAAAANALRLIEQEQARRQEAETLERTGRLIAASLDLDRTLEAIAQAAAELTQAEGAWFVLAVPGGRELEFRACYGPHRAQLEGRRIPPGSCVSGRAFRLDRAARVDDLEAEGAGRLTPLPPLVPPPRSLLSEPVRVGSEVLGVVTVVHPQPSHFDARHERLLSIFAAQAALVVEHARLYQEARRREEEANLLAEASALLQTPRSAGPTEELAALCRLVGERLDASAVFLLTAPGTSELRLAAAYELEPQAMEQLAELIGELPGRLDRGISGELVAAGRPLLLGQPRGDAAEAAAFGRGIGAPIPGARGPWGLLYVWTRPAGQLDHRDLRVVGLLADRLAAAFENSRLVREAAQVEAVRELDRMKTDLLDTVSHELRTPLSLIYGFAELMTDPKMRERFSREELAEMSGHIYSGAKVMTRLVDDLLEYARLEQGRFALQTRPVRLAELLEQELRAFRAQPGGERIGLHPRATLGEMEADEARLRQVIGNLLSNALKYAPEGPIELHARQDETTTTLEVVDHGPGIADTEKARVWERFYRGAAKNLAVRGSGIGLSVVKALVDAHGGRVALADTPGGGATFRVELPTRQGA